MQIATICIFRKKEKKENYLKLPSAENFFNQHAKR